MMSMSKIQSLRVVGGALLMFALQPSHVPAAGSAPSPKTALVKKYLDDCRDKTSKDGSCDKLRKDAIEILSDDLHTLGSSADRAYLLSILPVFKSDAVELRIAAADAVGMIGPQDLDVDLLIPLTNDPVPDVRQAVSQMISQGKGSALSLLKQRIMPMRTGRTPDKPADPAKLGLPIAPNSLYLFDSSDESLGRLSYVAKNMNEATAFFKGKAKKGPFQLQEFKDKYRFQFQDEEEAIRRARETEAKQMENSKPPDPTNVQAYTEFMQKIASAGARHGGRILLDSYQPALFGAPAVYVLEERQIGKRSYPTRYVVLYQEQALRKPGYRLAWMTAPDSTIKEVQEASLQEERQEEARNKENAALKKKAEELEALTKKKDAAEKKQFKKGQDDLEKALGF